MTDDPFLQTLLPTTHDLGGFKVHRTLPHRARTTIGPFIFFDQMGPATLDPGVGSSRVDLQACKLEYSIVSPK